jgi:NAD-dependent DNA ligase
VTHAVPMLSLGNVFNQEDLFAFARRIEERLPNQKVQYDVDLNSMVLRFHCGMKMVFGSWCNSW